MIVYRKGDLFSTLPSKSLNEIFLHSCNAQGVWGAGIALEFKKRFPKAYYLYQYECAQSGVLGKGFVSCAMGTIVGYLITSNGYGRHVDTPKQICNNTHKAIEYLFGKLKGDVIIHSPKINSGLFKSSLG